MTNVAVLEFPKSPFMNLTIEDKIKIADFSHCPMCDSTMYIKGNKIKKCSNSRCGLTAISSDKLDPDTGYNQIIVKRRNPNSKKTKVAGITSKYEF